jgi:hypothetical protein
MRNTDTYILIIVDLEEFGLLLEHEIKMHEDEKIVRGKEGLDSIGEMSLYFHK